MNSKCCGYGTDAGNTATAFDCAIIPGATKFAADANGLAQTLKSGAAYGFCGGELGTAGTIVAATVCCEYSINLSKCSLRILVYLYDTL